MTFLLPPWKLPLRVSFEVDCPAQHAFEVWTSEISRWWPTEHTVTGKQALDIVLEPRVGGRIYERTAGGAELDWGEITEWKPPRRIASRWHERRRRRTRVVIEHQGWERLGFARVGREPENEEAWGQLSRAAQTPVWERSSGCAGPYGFVTNSERRLLVETPLLNLFWNSYAGGEEGLARADCGS
jgi:uncharacterized protein YndB with AHSA1/START domain